MAYELLGVREVLMELKICTVLPIVIRVNNQAALKQLKGEKASTKAKHIDVRTNFIGECAKRGVIKPDYIETPRMPADLLTNSLPTSRMTNLQERIGLI